VGGGDIESQLLDQPGQPGRLSLGQIQHESRERRRVDDRVGQRAFQAATDQPGVEGIVAVLDEDRSLGESEEGPPRVTKLRRANQHRPVDVVALLGVGVDGCAAIDESVEKGQRSGHLESFRAELENQEWRVACRFDVDGDELRLVERGLRAELGGIDCDLLPLHGLRCAARFQEDRLHDCRLRADRTKSISSRVRARSRTADTA
jgi:hypothetical protein